MINKQKMAEIWAYFNGYISDIDPAGPFEKDWGKDEDQSKSSPNDGLFESPDEWFTGGFLIRDSWDKNGIALIVSAMKNQEQNLKDIWEHKKTGLEEFFAGSKIIFQSETCKLIITIDECPISEGIDLSFDQKKIMLERLAEAQILFFHQFCLCQ